MNLISLEVLRNIFLLYVNLVGVNYNLSNSKKGMRGSSSREIGVRDRRRE